MDTVRALLQCSLYLFLCSISTFCYFQFQRFHFHINIFKPDPQANLVKIKLKISKRIRILISCRYFADILALGEIKMKVNSKICSPRTSSSPASFSPAGGTTGTPGPRTPCPRPAWRLCRGAKHRALDQQPVMFDSKTGIASFDH